MAFWSGKRVLVTGHTGFKGSWLCELLLARQSHVFGLALEPEGEPALFEQLNLAERIDHGVADICELGMVRKRVAAVRPHVVLHLAAQSLVRRSYRRPVETWATNVMGTAHLLQAIRELEAPCTVIVVTTDKVYENREWEHPYRETDPLGGHDPYSASKAASEVLASSYRDSFFKNSGVRMATARAGNVIGGGDWSEDRIVPDLARAFAAGQILTVRNGHAVRPWQHVLDPLLGYLTLAEQLDSLMGDQLQTGFNFGPEPADQRSVSELVQAAQRSWPGEWTDRSNDPGPHEAARLSLSIERARSMLGWQPKWNFERAVAETIRWYRAVAEGGSALDLTQMQIAEFETGP